MDHAGRHGARGAGVLPDVILLGLYRTRGQGGTRPARCPLSFRAPGIQAAPGPLSSTRSKLSRLRIRAGALCRPANADFRVEQVVGWGDGPDLPADGRAGGDGTHAGRHRRGARHDLPAHRRRAGRLFDDLREPLGHHDGRLFCRLHRAAPSALDRLAARPGPPRTLHNDGTLRGTLEKLADAGVDCVDSVVPRPVGDVGLDELRRWRETKSSCWAACPARCSHRRSPPPTSSGK